ncbi:MAG: hypothetical protein WBP18_18750 [Paracoccaceae bacterium]
MDLEDIKDGESLSAWLDARPEATRRSDAVGVAERCALRVFPLFGLETDQSSEIKQDFTAPPVLRLNLTSGVSRNYSTPGIKEAIDAARIAYADSSAASAARAAADNALDRAVAVHLGAASAATAAVAASREATSDGSKAFAAPVMWEQVRQDARLLERGEDPFTVPLWSSAPPNWFTQADARTRAIWAQDPPGTWDFWTRWWDGVLSGQQLPWELQKAVALIPDAIWKQGPAAVAAEIARIEEIHDLRQQATMLKEQLAEALAVSASATTGHRAHNHPPELVDAPAEIRESLTIIWADLDAAEKELARSAPSGARLQRIGRALRTSVSVVLAYCGKSVDNFTQSAIKAAGGVAGVALFAYLLANIGTFAEALLKLAAKLVGG